MYLTSFIGRGREIREIEAFLASARLLTLTGAGGSGKTRVAVEIASRGGDRQPVAWVELAPLASPDLVVQVLSSALGIHDRPGRDAFDALVGALQGRSSLLVLDNCEHLLDACAEVADTLLRRCPDLKILATSRETLGVEGEVAWLIPPLALPAPGSAPTCEAIAEAEAVQLFVERARAARPSFALSEATAPSVLQICRRLDGLPLALELAAARVRALSPEQIAARLDDAFRLLTGTGRSVLPRHRTLRAAIDWSHALLSEQEQILLARLSVFAGGCSLEAAEVVCPGGAIEEAEVLDLLAALVDKSLVTLTESDGRARYHLLETVRQYAAQRLEERGETAPLRHRHLRHFLRIASEAAPLLHVLSPARALWIPRMLPDQDNFLAALAWSRGEDADPEAEIQLLAATWWLWHHLGRVGEAQRWMRDALERSPAATPTPARATVLLGAGFAAWMQGAYDDANDYLARSVALWRGLGERALFLVRSLVVHSHILRDLGELTASRRAAEEAIGLAAAGRGLPTDDAFALVGLGNTLHALGDFEGADRAYRDAEARWRRAGQSIGLAFAIWSRSALALDRGDWAGGAELARESLRTARATPNPWFICRPLEALGAALARTGDAVTGARLLGAAQAIRGAMGTPVQEFDRSRWERTLAALREALGEEECAAALHAGRALSMVRAIELGSSTATPTTRSATRNQTPTPAPPPVAPPTAGAAPGGSVLRVRALGPLQISSPEPGEGGAWSLAKPRELLLFLLCNPEGSSREQVGLALWPDASKAQVSNNFHVTLHRLRKALGGAGRVIAQHERYRIDPGLEIEFDAAIFEARVTEALRADGSAVRRPALQDAIALYQGDFLEGEVVGDWHLEYRDRLQRLYVTALLALGDEQASSGDPAAAALTYQQLLVRESFREDVYRRLMVCHARLGQRTSAMRLYQRLVALLEAEFGSSPEPETSALFHRLCEDQPV